MFPRLRAAIRLPNLAALARTESRQIRTNATQKAKQWKDDVFQTKYYTDTEWRRKLLDRQMQTKSQRRQNDPTFRQAELEFKRAWNRKRQMLDSHLKWMRLYQWCSRNSWVRDNLPWKTHRPLLYPERTEHQCSDCSIVFKNGFRLWWVETSSDDIRSYRCGPCHSKNAFESITPDGFADATTMVQVKAKAKALGIETKNKESREEDTQDRAS
ncbi:hypothetical protein AUEXF2481DRAFT_26919 [Aureobasidium subglaciale EXF-2481]|uniref:Uncharacterized protein n=1 Tax=Aureobasidium subglaciale (strain EXF-2481) TaxID=1043005 RepID=A0A074YWK5_AURSE|nr:uncharacterized protein AUEXF2481DRAFT_26919 [Aureobasidium subglaciale EXF-2481]KEQ98552.1 hypothetical protein AUEXF2481DRAFT_26919 [Aureobasidium subglaciale EXF-2481]